MSIAIWWAYTLSAAGYGLLAGALLVLGRRNPQSRLLVAALATHALWALGLGPVALPAALVNFLTTAHFSAWAIFFGSIFPDRRADLPRTVIFGSLAMLAARVGLALAPALPAVTEARLSLGIDLLAVILALTATAGLFQAAGEFERWALKFFCFPIGALFAYDLFLYTQALAVAPPSGDYLGMRGLLSAAMLPLVAVAIIRHRAWRKSFSVSRQAALYSVTLIGIGLYLLLVAAASLLLQDVAFGEALPLQIGLLFGALLLLVFLLSSGSIRAKIKFLLARHFYPRKYDYAHEWRKFMQTLATDGDKSPLETRIIRACADLLEVPGGALWVFEKSRPRLQAVWNYRVPAALAEGIDIEAFRGADGELQPLYEHALAVSSLGEQPDAWVAVPLPHGQALLGVILLSKPRARHELDQEDCELLMLIARQCASFLAENRATSTLEETKQFARFNRQYAFVAHDIKNIISQLSVMLTNFERHADNPDFQRDMQETVGNAVERLRRLAERLKHLAAGKPLTEAQEAIAVSELLEGVIEERRRNTDTPLSLWAAPKAREARVRASRDRLAAIVGHLLSNAVEAAGRTGEVRIRLDIVGAEMVLEISDDGPGMTLDFVRDQLFTPFQSTKSGGFGVGAYQCREFAREQGGDLDVVSSPGSGTTMRLRLPLAGDSGETMVAQTV